MKRKLRTLILTALTILTGTSLTAYGEAPMTQPPNTSVCIGRFLVDLPADGQVAISSTYQRMEYESPVHVRDFAEMEEQLKQRAAAYRAVRMLRTPESDRSWRRADLDPNKLFSTTQLVGFEVDASLQQAIIGYQPNPRNIDLVIELHKVIGQRDYIFQIKSDGADDYPKTRQTMWSAGATFQPLTPGAIPRGPGFCIDGGMFADTGKPPVRERAALVVTFADHPDVRFVLDANAIDKVDEDEPSLKFRMDSELSILRAGVPGHVGVLERGALTAAGQDGYQIAVSAPYEFVPNTRMLKFFWSADGVSNDVTRPFMEVEMTVQPTTEGQSTIRDDSDAKELWKQLMQGIRVRPGAV